MPASGNRLNVLSWFVQRQADLLEVVGALGAGAGVAHFLHRWQQQPDQDRG